MLGIQQLEARRHSCNKTYQGFLIVRANANPKPKFGLHNDRRTSTTGNVGDVNSVARHFGAFLDVLGDLRSAFVPIAENYKVKGSEKRVGRRLESKHLRPKSRTDILRSFLIVHKSSMGDQIIPKSLQRCKRISN